MHIQVKGGAETWESRSRVSRKQSEAGECPEAQPERSREGNVLM